MTKSVEQLYLIDGSSYIYRAYHTLGSLSNSQGFPTGAVFGFTNMLMRTLREREPAFICVVFDAPGPTFRHDRYADYKANRPPMPEDLRIQIPRIHELVAALEVPSISVPGFEADDVIATLVDLGRSHGCEVVIVSGDKDLMQLVGDGVVMWDPQKNIAYDPSTVTEKFGVRPDQIVDYLALVGDSSDNVPGVPGVGQKTATQLLDEFGSIDRMYESLDAIGQKRARNSLQANRDKALLSRDLIRLYHSVPLETGINDLARKTPDQDHLRSLFTELEFQRYLDELPAPRRLDTTGYTTIQDHDELLRWIEAQQKAGSFALDLETTSQVPVRADLVGISLSCKEGEACYIPVGHVHGTQLPKADVLQALRPLLECEQVHKVGQNIKYDVIVLKREGIEVRGIGCDTMLASYILDPSRRSHGLDALALALLNHRTIPIKDLIGTGKSQRTFAEVNIEEAVEYACEDADVTYRISRILCPRVDAEGLGELFRDVELPLISILADMEIAGVRVDTAYLDELSIAFGKQVKDLEEEIYQLAGTRFNVNSPKQLAEILFGKLGLKPLRKTKTGHSTSLEVLESLALQHDLPRKIVEYRSVFKLKSTYVDALRDLVNPLTGRIHTSFNQAVAATGRLSSSDPNLQNIPIRTPEGRKIRRAFIPEPGSVFVAADYSQIELRMMAHLSGDARLQEAFAQGQDVHATTAASVFGAPASQVTAEMRRKAKAINFGIIYGMGPFNLAGQLGVGLNLAKQYLADYYAMYAGVKQFMDDLPKQAAELGYVTTILGRKRFLPDLNNPNKNAQQAARRMAINTTMQGSAADIMKLAMIRIDAAMKHRKLPGQMILQVHDEVVIEVPERAADDTAKMLKDEMEGVYTLSVPLVVDTAIGSSWDEVH